MRKNAILMSLVAGCIVMLSGYVSQVQAQVLPVTANRIFHVEASQASNTNSPTTTTLNDGDPIYYWTDLSGNDVHVSQSTGANQPIYRVNRVNGLPALNFNGSSHQLVSATGANLTPTDIFAVVMLDSTAPSFACIVGELTTNEHPTVRRAGTTQAFRGNVPNDGTDNNDFSWGNKLYVNGALTNAMPAYGSYMIVHAQKGPYSDEMFSQLGVGLGRSTGRAWKGDIVEIIMYSADQSANQNAIGWYLSQKYNIATSYLDPNGPVATMLPLPASNISVGAPQTLRATAVPVAGAALTQMEFFVNGVSIGTTTTPDINGVYSIGWTPAAAGYYVIYAQATDDLSLVGRSNIIGVSVGVIYVRAATDGGLDTNSGADWNNAKTFAGAIAAIQGQTQPGIKGGVIYMAKGTHPLAANLPAFTVTPDITIYGGFDPVTAPDLPTRNANTQWVATPTTISGTGNFSLFNVGTVGLKNLTLDGVNVALMKAATGPVLYMNFSTTTGSITLTNTNLDANSATATGDNLGGGCFYFAGFAAQGMTLNASSCSITNNLGTRTGGVFWGYDVSYTFNSCSFIRNQCNGEQWGSGGVFYIASRFQPRENSVLTMNDCQFIGNKAANGQGGVLGGDKSNRNRGADYPGLGIMLNVNRCTFVLNQALGTTANQRFGGALCIFNGTVANINASTFTANTASENGGAILIHSNGNVAPYPSTTITSTSFVQNSAAGTGNGGCIGASCLSTLTLIGCTFTTNTAGNGGGVYGGWTGGSDKTLYMINCKFYGNIATNTNGGVMNLWDTNTKLVTVSGCDFIANKSKNDGGALRMTGGNGTMTIDNCLFSRNTCTAQSGGAIWFDHYGYPLTITNSQFIGNTASASNGGAFYCNNGNTTLLNCLFDSNLASPISGTGEGGVAVIARGKGRIDNCIFNNNRSKNNGGALRIYRHDTAITSSTFTSNYAGNGTTLYYNGGAIAWDSDGVTTEIYGMTFDRCYFGDNRSSDGAAVLVNYSPTPTTVTNCIFFNNIANNRGAYYQNNTAPVYVDSCVFTSNTARGDSGSFKTDNATLVTVLNSQFIQNASYGVGGGPSPYNGTFIITNCLMKNNLSYNNDGGGMASRNMRMTMERCWFEGNTSGRDGGGLYMDNDASSQTIINTVFVNNTAKRWGGAITRNGIGPVQVVNCTLSGNSALQSPSYDYPDGIYVSNTGGTGGAGLFRVLNCVFDRHSAAYMGVSGANPGQLINCLFGVTGRTALGLNDVRYGALTNPIYADPLFVNAGANDFRLQNTSLAIGAGATDIAGIVEAPDADYALVARPAVGMDLGAYENSRDTPIPVPPTPVTPIFVTRDGTGDGSSWANAANLPTAVALAPYDGTLCLAGYDPAPAEANDYALSGTLMIGHPLAIVGQFIGSDATPFLRQNDKVTTINGLDTYRPFIIGATSVTLDGLNVTRGMTTGAAAPAAQGGGIYLDGGALTMNNCAFSSNSARWDGGGIYAAAGFNLVINGCYFTSNTAYRPGGVGGGAAICTEAGNSSVKNTIFFSNLSFANGAFFHNGYGRDDLSNCQFTSNLAAGEGAAFKADSSTTFTCYNSIFRYNFSQNDGAAMNLWPANATTIKSIDIADCSFIGNNTNNQGSVIRANLIVGNINRCVFDSNNGRGAPIYLAWTNLTSVTIANSSFTSNSARDWNGGAINADFAGMTVTVDNCVFTSNLCASSGGAIRSIGLLTVSNSKFTSNSATVGDGGAIYLYGDTATASFSNCQFNLNYAFSAGGAIRRDSRGSLSLVNSTFASNRSAFLFNGLYTDGIYLNQSNGPTTILNCLFDDSNTAIYNAGGGYPANTGNCLFGLTGHDGLANATIGCVKTNCVINDSRLADLPNGNFALQNSSPAINAGAALAFGVAVPATDILGVARTTNVDIGAYEGAVTTPDNPPTPPTPPTPLIICVTTTGTGAGTNWTTDPASLAYALVNYTPQSQIWMQTGVYNVATSFTINAPLNILGGFAGTEALATDRVANYWTDNPTTIAATASNAILSVGPLTNLLSLDALCIAGGRNSVSPGGAIYMIVGDLTASRCEFINNATTNQNGGAIACGGGTLSLNSCRFLNNNAAGATGGAIWLGNGGVAADSTVFYANTAANGGAAIYGLSCGIALTGCQFTNNIAAANNGGALYFSYAGGTISSTVFTGNQTAGQGGALWTRSGPLTVTNSTFTNSAAPGGGAAICITDALGTTLTLTGCTIQGSTVSGTNNGGGLYFNNGPLILRSTNFLNNSVGTVGNGTNGLGGAIWMGAGLLDAGSCVFDGNLAINGGAAIRTNNAGTYIIMATCTIKNNTVNNNATFAGGAVWKDNNTPISVTACDFINNQILNAAGNPEGAALHTRNSATAAAFVTSCTFVNNVNLGRFGAIRTNEEITFTNCVFDRNSCAANDYGGGGIGYLGTRNLTINNCIFMSNSANATTNNNREWGGGAVFMQDSNPSYITNCVFSQNRTANYGGAINRRGAGLLYVVNCSFYGNRADLNWNGHQDTFMVNNSGTASYATQIINCIFDNQRNVLAARGGGVFAYLRNNLYGPLGAFQVDTATGSTNIGAYAAQWFRDSLTAQPIPPNYDGAAGSPNAYRVDPLFIAPVGHNLDLQNASPASNAGMMSEEANSGPTIRSTNPPIVIPTLDIMGRARNLAWPSVGAYEISRNALTYSPAAIDFGSAPVGSVVTTDVVITAVGNNYPVIDSALFQTSGSPFSVVGTFQYTLAPGQSATITIQYNPAAPGQYEGWLQYNDPEIVSSIVPLTGATPPQVLSIVALDATPTSGPFVLFQATFSQPVENIDATDFAAAVTAGYAEADAILPSVVSVGSIASTSVIVLVNGGYGVGQIGLNVVGASNISDVVYHALLSNIPFASGGLYDFSNYGAQVVFIDPLGPDPTSATTVDFAVRFNEPVTGVSMGAFAFSNPGGLGLVTGISGGAADYVLTVSGVTAGAQTGVNTQLWLVDGSAIVNALDSPMTHTYTTGTQLRVDQVAPGCDPNINVEPSSNSVVDQITITTVTFNEPVLGVTTACLTITTDGVTIAAPLSVSNPSADGMTYIFAIDDSFGSGPIQLIMALAGGVICDPAGNFFAGAQWSIVKDANVIPVSLSSAMVDNGGLTSLTAIVLNAHFNSPVTGFDPINQLDDVTTDNCTVTAFSGSGNDYLITITPVGQGAVSLRIPTNVCNHALFPTRFNATSNLYSFTFDNALPSFSNFTAAPSRAKVGASVNITCLASEPLGADPALTVNGNPAAFISGAGESYTFQYTVQVADTEGSATLAASGNDLAWNFGQTPNGIVLFVDKTPPSAVISIDSPDAGALVTVTFSEEVTGVDIGDFVLTRDGTQIYELSNFTKIGPMVYTLIVGNTTPGLHVLRLVAATSGVQDMATIPMAVDAVGTWRVAPAASTVEMWTRY